MWKLAGCTALVLAAVLASPVAGAGQSATYQGVITGAEFRCGDLVKHPYSEVTGHWALNASGAKTATVSMNVSYDGRHHLSFGLSQGDVGVAGGALTATFLGGAGTAKVEGDQFTWKVFLGTTCNSDDQSYDSLTYTGEAGD